MYTAYLHGFNIEAPMDVLGIIITPLKSLPPHSLSRPIRGRGREWINRAFILVPVDPPPTERYFVFAVSRDHQHYIVE